MTTPEVSVEIALTSGYMTPAASRTWTDVTAYVEAADLLRIARGRADEFANPNASTLSLTLDNRDGRFTPEYTSGAYYPNIKKGRPIRVRVRWVPTSGTWYDRILGYVDEWPVQWPGGSDAYATVNITATSRMARLGKSAPFKSIVEEELLYDAPTLYFPLGEPSGSLTAGDIAPGLSDRLTVTQDGSGGTLEFGAGTGPGTDGLSAPVFTPVDALNGKVLSSALVDPLMSGSATVLEYECFVNVSPTAFGPVVMIGDGLSQSGNGLLPATYINVNGSGVAQVWFAATGLGTFLVSGATVNDGLTHHLAARLEFTGGNAVVSLMVDGGTRVSNSTAYTGPIPGFRYVYVGGGPIATMFAATTISHVSVRSGTTTTSDARITTHANAGLTGFTTDASGARVARYARLAGIPTAEVSVETGLSTSIANIDTTGMAPIEAMQKVAETEDGIVFDGKDGAVTFHARSHRYAATSAFTLDASTQAVGPSFSPVLDDQGVTNDMTASRANGAEVRSVNQGSITEYGYYRTTTELVTTSDNEVQSRADWEVNRFGTPRTRVTSVEVDVMTSSSALVALLLAADIGTRFTITNLPAQAPSSTMDLFIEGVTEEIGAETYRMTFNTSAVAYANVWIWDSSTNAQWDQTTVFAY